MPQFVSHYLPEWLLLLVGIVLVAWIGAHLYRRVRPFKQRQRLHSDRRKKPRTSGRRNIDEPGARPPAT